MVSGGRPAELHAEGAEGEIQLVVGGTQLPFPLLAGPEIAIQQDIQPHHERYGERIVVWDRLGGRETVALAETAGAQALFVPADVSRPEDCEALVQQTVARFGRLDMACNNAGIGGGAICTLSRRVPSDRPRKSSLRVPP